MMKLKQSLKNSIKLALLLSLLSLCLSCQNTKSTSGPAQDPQHLFLKSFNNTLKLKTPLYANAKMANTTLWVYVATDEEILTLDRKQSQGKEDEKKETIFLQLKGDYSGNFQFYYDIFRLKDLPPTSFKEEAASKGINEGYTNLTHDILQKAFVSLMDLVYSTDAKNLKFFVVSIADIKKGIEIKTIINRSDLEKLMVNIITSEQFYGTRTIYKEKGDETITGDKTGKHLDYKEIVLENFIVELTAQKARQEFAKLKDEEKTNQKIQGIILKNIYEFTKIYEFDNFYAVEMTDIASNNKESMSKYELTEKFKDSGL